MSYLISNSNHVWMRINVDSQIKLRIAQSFPMFDNHWNNGKSKIFELNIEEVSFYRYVYVK